MAGHTQAADPGRIASSRDCDELSEKNYVAPRVCFKEPEHCLTMQQTVGSGVPLASRRLWPNRNGDARW